MPLVFSSILEIACKQMKERAYQTEVNVVNIFIRLLSLFEIISFLSSARF